MNFQQMRCGVKEWCQERFSRRASDDPYYFMNSLYILAFLEANDDYFDYGFRKEMASILGVDLPESTAKLQVEQADRRLRQKERDATFGDGVAPREVADCPAFVSVERVLSKAEGPERRRRTVMGWEQNLDVAWSEVQDLIESLSKLRRQVESTRYTTVQKQMANRFLAKMVEALDPITTIMGNDSSICSSTVVDACLATFTELPRLSAHEIKGKALPLLVATDIIVSIADVIGDSLGCMTAVDKFDGYWVISFTVPGSGVKRKAEIVVWEMVTHLSDSVSQYEKSTKVKHSAFGEYRPIPVAHAALRTVKDDRGLSLVHLRDLRGTLHEIGHGIHHSLTADSTSARHALDTTDLTQIDLLSTWMENRLFDPHWKSTWTHANSRRSSVDIEPWLNYLRCESLKEFPMRVLVAKLDFVWQEAGNDSDFQNVWIKVTGTKPTEHPYLFLETLHRLTWPIPTTQPGYEYGLLWATSEVSERENNQNSNLLPMDWVERIERAEAGQCPDPFHYVRRLLQTYTYLKDRYPEQEHDEIVIHEHRRNEYIASMLPRREDMLTDILKNSLVANSIVPIHVGDNAARLLQCFSLIKRPRRAVEIGTLFGYSAIHIARGLPTDGKLYSYEVDKRLARIAERNIASAGLADRVEIVAENALERVREHSPASIDFIFIDGAKIDYVEYLKICFPLLAPGGIMILDDAFATGEYGENEGRGESETNRTIRRAVKALANAPSVVSSFISTDHGMLVAVRK